MSTIRSVTAKEIKDSRGNPTIEVRVETNDGNRGSFAVPSGKSTGIHEAKELRDPDGGMTQAIFNVGKIGEALRSKDVRGQKEIDEMMIELDGTPQKSHLGANAILGVSLACARAASSSLEIPLFEYLSEMTGTTTRKPPLLFMNLINGGAHALEGPAFQEYMVVPETKDTRTSVEVGIEIQNEIEQTFKDTEHGDEGGVVLSTKDVLRPLEAISESINDIGQPKVNIALDVAASSFFDRKNGCYLINDKAYSPQELKTLYGELISRFPVTSVEDPFQEEDFGSFAELMMDQPRIAVVGDDLTVTNPKLIKKAIGSQSINAVIIKPNQIGTLTEVLESVRIAQEQSLKVIVSHRSGETMDDFIADLAWSVGAYGLKAGSPKALERKAKYDRLIKIQESFSS